MKNYIQEFESYYKIFREGYVDYKPRITESYDYINGKIDIIIDELEVDVKNYQFIYDKGRKPFLDYDSFYNGLKMKIGYSLYLIDIFKLIKNILEIEYSWGIADKSIISLLNIVNNYPKPFLT